MRQHDDDEVAIKTWRADVLRAHRRNAIYYPGTYSSPVAIRSIIILIIYHRGWECGKKQVAGQPEPGTGTTTTNYN